MHQWLKYEDFAFNEKLNRKNSPRTKNRPIYKDALIARIVSVDGDRYKAIIYENSPEERYIKAICSKEIRKKIIIVPGDFVYIIGDYSGAHGSLARIVKIKKRNNILTKNNNLHHAFVANIDQLIIVAAVKSPKPYIELIDRMILASLIANIRPIICITKIDLCSSKDIYQYYKSLNIKIIESSMIDKSSLNNLRILLNEKVSAFAGLSGVGKSTLINLLTGSNRKVRKVNHINGGGRHTSSSSCAIRLSKYGWIIDTPGVSYFDISKINKMKISHIVECFPEIKNIIYNCKKGCNHNYELADCAINYFIEQSDNCSDILNARINSFRKIIKNVSLLK